MKKKTQLQRILFFSLCNLIAILRCETSQQSVKCLKTTSIVKWVYIVEEEKKRTNCEINGVRHTSFEHVERHRKLCALMMRRRLLIHTSQFHYAIAMNVIKYSFVVKHQSSENVFCTIFTKYSNFIQYNC